MEHVSALSNLLADFATHGVDFEGSILRGPKNGSIFEVPLGRKKNDGC